MWGSCSPVAQRLSWWFGLCMWIFEQLQGVGQLLLLEICGHSWILKAVDLMKLWLKCSGSCWTGQIIIEEQWQKQCTEVSDRIWQVHQGRVAASGSCGRYSLIKMMAIKQILVSENCEEDLRPLLWSIVCWFSWCVMKYWGDVQRLKEIWFLL